MKKDCSIYRRIRGMSGQREGDDPPNGLKEAPGHDGGRGPLENAIVMLMLLFPRRAEPPSPGGMGSAGPGKKNLGG